MNRETRNARALLASIAAETSSTSLRLVCPFCGGGATNEHSLVLTMRPEGAFYCCHRASCGEVGMVAGKADIGGIRTVCFQPKNYTEPYTPLKNGSPWGKVFRKCVGGPISIASIYGLYQGADPNLAVWECRDLYGQLTAHQTRLGLPGTGPKQVKTYKATQGPVFHHIPNSAYNRLVVVEDPLSAACAARQGFSGVALLGTYCSEELAFLIGERNYQDIVVILDPGAEQQAKDVGEVLAAYCGPVRRLYLRDDLKNLPSIKQWNLLQSAFHL